MKIILTSDTHYGFDHKTPRVLENFLQDIYAAILDNDVKVVVHAGDWISHKQSQFPKVLDLFRKYISVPILAVRGNHDFWAESHLRKSKPKHDEYHHKLFNERGILPLESGLFFKTDGVTFTGFDGWYNEEMPPTNDVYRIPPHNMLDRACMGLYKKEAEKDFENALYRIAEEKIAVPKRPMVCITHFPIHSDNPDDWRYNGNRRYFDFLAPHIDYLLFGHSHRRVQEIKNGVELYNCGSDYNKPNYSLIDIEGVEYV